MKLGDREYKLDLMKISAGEFFSLFVPETPVEVEREIISRAWGLTVDEYMALPLPLHRELNVEFLRQARNPTENPNSVSGSTST